MVCCLCVSGHTFSTWLKVPCLSVSEQTQQTIFTGLKVCPLFWTDNVYSPVLGAAAAVWETRAAGRASRGGATCAACPWRCNYRRASGWSEAGDCLHQGNHEVCIPPLLSLSLPMQAFDNASFLSHNSHVRGICLGNTSNIWAIFSNVQPYYFTGTNNFCGQ